MNLLELKKDVDQAIEKCIDYGDKPESVIVFIQIDSGIASMWSKNIDSFYDHDGCASGLVIRGDAE